MFTIRFENDFEVSMDGAEALLIEAEKVKANRSSGKTQMVSVVNGVGEETNFPLSHGALGYDRCYVMNATGKTIAVFSAPTFECVNEVESAA